jgi:hypothetical protein
MDQQDLQDYGKTFVLTERLSLCHPLRAQSGSLVRHAHHRPESSPFTQGVISNLKFQISKLNLLSVSICVISG